MKLTDRTELTAGFTPNDLIHIVNGGASYKAKLATALSAYLGVSNVALVVHVAKNGNDATGDGSRAKPFLTIAAALASITDAATGKRYCVLISPGTYNEASVALKPFVWLTGLGNSQGGCTRVTVTGNKVTVAASFATGNNRAGLKDIYFSGSTGIEIDLAALGSSGSNVFEFQNVGMNGDMTFKPNSAADFLDWVTGRIFGATTIQGGNSLLQQIYFAGGAINTNTLNTATNADFLACEVASNVTATSSSGRANNTRFLACSCEGSVTSDQATTTVTFAGGGVASVPSSTNSGVIASTSIASLTKFTAGNPSHWDSTAPVTVQAAIDRIAAVVGNPTPIP